MRALIWVIGAGVFGLAIWLWGFGGVDQVSRLAAAGQRDAQNAMATTLRALKGGQPGAVATLWGLCFAYGFFHAVGPGHGKLVIGGYGVANKVPMLRLSLLALGASLAQAVTAVVVVYAALWTLDWGREQIVGATERMLAPLSYGLIALVGLWLCLRGLRHLRQAGQEAEHAHHSHHTHGEGEVCSSCGHRHGPTLQEAQDITTWRSALALIGVVAIRPCTGAIFILILTWQLGLAIVGIAAAFAMALGTASVTIAVAIAASLLREGAMLSLGGTGMRRMAAVLEICAGGVIALLAIQIALRLV